MKNKKLLVFLLAAVSVSALGAAACKTEKEPANEHEHSYTWHSNAAGHWEECDCSDKKDVQNHVDVKNNETNADGKDGKCDVCDYALKQSVTFNMGGHGTAPDSQLVDFGATINKPADPEEDAWDFLGWYKDAACQTPFDFSAPIKDDTVIYAKWEENTTPGESKKYAYELELGKNNLQSITAKGYIYFKYTAEEDGRYEFALGGGNSAKCYFTTDKDEADIYYGNGYEKAKQVYDVFKDETVYIKLACAETLSQDAKVSPVVTAVYNEDLPADDWLDGIYTNGGTTFTLDREAKTISLYDNSYPFNYIGGSFDTLSFTHTTALGSQYDTDYKFINKKNGTFLVKAYSKQGGEKTWTYAYYGKVENPVEKSLFSGEYVPVNGKKGDGIDKFVIKEDGNGYYVNDGVNTSANGSYDPQYGMLLFGQYIVTLNVENGSAVSISVFSSTFTEFVVYERVGDVLPDKLPLNNNDEFIGDKYTVRDDFGTQYWGATGNISISITGFDKASNKYTVSANGVTYVLAFKGEGNAASIEVYNATGETLLDTLKYYYVEYHDLPSAATNEVTAPLADFKKDFYHFEVKESGWYAFSNFDSEKVEIYYNINKNFPTATYLAKLVGSESVYLEAGSVVGVKNLTADNTGNVTFTVAKNDAPKGFTESDPYEVNGLGKIEVVTLSASSNLYVKFTPSSAGNYFVTVSRAGMGAGTTDYHISYSVGGTQAGFDYSTYKWLGGLTETNHNYKLTATYTNPIMIVVYGGGTQGDFDDVVVTVTNDYTVGAVNLGEFVNGTPVGGKLPASVTVSGSGTYKVSDTFGSDLVLSSSSAFTAKVNGLDVEVTENNGTYTATVSASTNVYVEVSAAVTFTITFDEGTEKYPIPIDMSDIKFTHSVDYGTTYLAFKQAGTYVVWGSPSGYFYLNGEYISGGAPITVEAGDVLKVEHYYDKINVNVSCALPDDILGEYKYTDGDTVVLVGATALTVGDKVYSLSAISGNAYTFKAENNSTVTLTVSGNALTLDGHTLATVDNSIFTEDQVGTYVYKGFIDVTLTLNADGTGIYKTNKTYDIVVTEVSAGNYQFEYNNRTIEFTFNSDGNISLTDSSMGVNGGLLVKEAPPAAGTVYTGILSGGDTEMEMEVEFTLSADRTSATFSFVGESSYNVTITESGGTYFFSFNDGWDENATFTINGDSIVLTVDYYGSGTLTKQA
ncbi:MAG: InlB B-repeat-containing protein [Clostridia bacterium]|nr:InlB B-repeat-containing protein [Clostridia bacterium]